MTERQNRHDNVNKPARQNNLGNKIIPDCYDIPGEHPPHDERGDCDKEYSRKKAFLIRFPGVADVFPKRKQVVCNPVDHQAGRAVIEQNKEDQRCAVDLYFLAKRPAFGIDRPGIAAKGDSMNSF